MVAGARFERAFSGYEPDPGPGYRSDILREKTRALELARVPAVCSRGRRIGGWLRSRTHNLAVGPVFETGCAPLRTAIRVGDRACAVAHVVMPRARHPNRDSR